jgi:hypothetical protein
MQHLADSLIQSVYTALPKLQSISDEAASEKPHPEKWSKKEVLGHLIDSACNNQQKFVRTMAQSHVDFTGYQQDFWVEAQQYNQAPWAQLLTLWQAYNEHIAHIMAHVSPVVLAHTISINGSEPMTLQFIMEDYPVHLNHHLKQIFSA